MRVYELARELGLKSDELLKRCADLGLRARNRLSGVDESEAAILRKAVASKAAAAQATAEAAKTTSKAEAAKTRAKKAKPEAKTGAKTKEPEEKRPPPPETAAEAPAQGEAVRRRRRRRPAKTREPDEPEPQIQQLPGRYIPPASIQRYRRRPTRRSRTRRFRRAEPGAVKKQTSFTIETPVSVKDLSATTGIKANTIILKLMQTGEMVAINAVLDEERVRFLGKELGIDFTIRERATAEDAVAKVEQEADRPEDLKARPPVVTFLGHVDHGKTSLLDFIRKANVVAGEHGGITQHIGAYRATIAGHAVVFLDTPGHEAFTAMRARGANVTDIVALVVAADDGVMPQTEEAIDHARAADVPIVVAINKCDRPDANPDRVKQQLTQLGLQPEEWGGDTVCVEVSAITGQGVDELVEMLALVAELRELKANPDKAARGAVLEAEISESRGPIATVLVRDGTLRIGQAIVCGAAFGRVKALQDDRGRRLKEAGPATPVAVVGLDKPPDAGDQIVVLDDLQKARAVAEERGRKAREASVTRRVHIDLDNLFASIEQGQVSELKLILKADGQGSLEALRQVLDGIKSDEVGIRVLRSSVGGITTSDVILADASDAILVGLHVTADPVARSLAEERGVALHTYNVIYRVKEDIEKALVGMLQPEEREVIAGHAEIRRIFRISRFGNIAGCFVTDGLVARNHRARLLREGAVIHQGRLASLRREKDDVRDVREGFECGIHLDGYDDIKVGDVIETFHIEKIARTLDSARPAPDKPAP